MKYEVIILKNQEGDQCTRYAFFLLDEVVSQTTNLFPGAHCTGNGEMGILNEYPDTSQIIRKAEFTAVKINLEFISSEFFPENSYEFLKEVVDKCLRSKTKSNPIQLSFQSDGGC